LIYFTECFKFRELIELTHFSMKKQFQKIGSLLGIASLALVGFGIVPINAETTDVFTANDDGAVILVNEPVVIAVLNNDTGPVTEYTLQVKTPPLHGSTEILGDAGTYTIKYFPAADYVGEDEFYYVACQRPQVGCSTARVFININSNDVIDSDGDGIVNSNEMGDVNGDGLMDKDQQNVAGFANNAGYLEADANCALKNVTVGDTADAVGAIIGGVSQGAYAANEVYGAVRFDSEFCLQTRIKLVYSNPKVSMQDFHRIAIFKNGITPTGSTGWFDFTNKVSVQDLHITKKTVELTYNLTDGGLGDNGADGKIIDPIIIFNKNLGPNANPALIRTGGIF
jgi:hypothetical protein